jgi:flagellar hook-associated protein 1 FlgK
MIGEIGVEAQNLERDKEHFEVVMNQIRSQREGLSGVSLDEEMINLVKYQQAYTAAAKLLTTLDEMLTTLIQTA